MATDTRVVVGIMLDRAASQSTVDALLNGDWADRQSAISNQGNGIWSTYGADPTTYSNIVAAITTALGTSDPISRATALGYSGSAENRTIWLELDPGHFQTLFNSTLLSGDGVTAWTGPLSLPSTISLSSIAGLWVDSGVAFNNPVHGAGVPAVLPAPEVGPVSIGNAAGDAATVNATPAAIAQAYNFPLPTTLSSEAIALIETGLDQPGLLDGLNAYRQQLGLPLLTPAELQILSGGNTPINGLGEVALDMSVVSGVAPNSAIYLYGTGRGLYQAYQTAFFDSTRNPEVVSSSWTPFVSMTAGSPFQAAWQQLFIDGMLSGASVHIAIGDRGSDGFWANGTGNAPAGSVPAYALVVGGTSVAAPFSAASDSTLETIYLQAMQGDATTIFELVEAGLKTLPSSLSAADPRTLTAGAAHPYSAQLTHLIESVWNEYAFVQVSNERVVGFGSNQAGSGGVDPTQPVPFYQTAFGLTPGTTPASPNGTGRGAPDVSALAGGDAGYSALNADYVTGTSSYPVNGTGGTSAAAPLWATLTSQFNVIFRDQGLPSLGFYNDLLYIAAAIAPASFNDIVLGNNDSGFFNAAHYTGYVADGHHIQPTGVGYDALPGYDLATGLGTPNGTLLARALTQIAHEQMYHDGVQAFLASDGAGGWDAGATETLLFQASATTTATVHVSAGSEGHILFTQATEPLAWTARLAEQSLQSDFDPNLVRLFDGQAQGALLQETIGGDTGIVVRIDGVQAQTPQAGMTTPFGFADFATAPAAGLYAPDVRVALPVAIAETAGGSNDAVAIVRVRQNGENSTTLTLFKVDDQAGSIDFGGVTVRPGDASYAAAAQGRAYQTSDGGSSIGGPGYGQFAQAAIVNVDAGDIIALKLTNNTTGQTFWSFAAANETVDGQHVAHVWNYGLNTWGFEDMYGGGDRDYNDLVVGLDFTSAVGHGYLV